jgi:beta-1,4-mannooligosaccharide/beta-1,4-mannosyl-N-acetylglucosamine phosphorylase
MPPACASVFNAGATIVDGQLLLLVRAEDHRGISALWIARSRDGVSGWEIEQQPFLRADNPSEAWGCEDPRITWVPELDAWVIAYTAYSPNGPAVALARTRDFRTVERIGLVLPPTNKDAALFPRRFGGSWVLMHRPAVGDHGDIWLAYSPDLVHWGRPHMLFASRGVVRWDGWKIGAGAQPIETDAGWVLLYHGVKWMSGGPVYRVGAALVDRERPWELLARGEEWILGPVEPYERVGDVPNVVFPCGAILRNDEVWMYYGAADASICLATAPLTELLSFLERARLASVPTAGPTRSQSSA